MIPAAALAAVPGTGPGEPAPRIEPLAGGVVNRSFRVETRAGRYVLRLNADAARARELGIERGTELAAQRLAAAAGLAPRVIASAPDPAFLVTEWVEGGVAPATAFATPDGMRRFGATLARLRDLPVTYGAAWSSGGSGPGHGVATGAAHAALAPGPSLITRARRLVARARAVADARESDALARMLEAAERGWEVSGAGARRPCLVHSDPNPGNVIWASGDASLVLLDWEYAHVGDPLQDPAAWLQACPALRGRQGPLLRACGLAGRADETMLDGMVAVYEALARAWRGVAETPAGIPPGRRAN